MEVGELIDGRYHLIRALGAGGFGTVWLAEEVALRRHVAIKFLHASFDDTTHRRFQRETEALARLADQHIVTMYRIGESDRVPYIVTEYVAGDTLSVWATMAPSLEQILAVVTQIAHALHAAHRAGIVHRDLKPANVMVAYDSRGAPVVKVLDFGIAKLTGPEQYDVTKTGEVIGTPGFMSPEQLKALPVGPATDLYNLGVILWELIEGRPLFYAENSLERCMLHLRQQPPPLTQPVPSAVTDLVSRLLQKAPAARGRTVDVLRALGAPQPALSVDTVAPRAPTGVAAAVFGGLVVALVVGAALLSMSKEAPARRIPASSSPTRAHALTTAEQEPVPTIETPDTHPLPDHGTPGCGIDWAPGAVLAGSDVVRSKSNVRLSRDDDRSLIIVPPGYDPQRPMPLILVLHDGGQPPAFMARQAKRLVELADGAGIILVFAEGTRLRTAKTLLRAVRQDDSRADLPMAGYPWLKAQVTELPNLISVIDDAFCVDRNRRYLVGHGRGAGGAEHLLTLTNDFAAVALTAHRRKAEDRSTFVAADLVPRLWIVPNDSRALTDDGKLNDCRRGFELEPYATQRDAIREAHGCHGTASKVETSAGGTCETWTCDIPLVACRIDGGQHWPDYAGGTHRCTGPNPTFDLGGEIWAFFEQVSREP